MLDSAFKERVHQECLKTIEIKLEFIQNEFRLYQESAANETKSTAGDKHDTGKAMMQMEQEKLGAQLKELLNSKSILVSLNPKTEQVKVNLGSLMETNHGIFYFAVSLGKIIIDGIEVLVISMQSPLAQLFLNKVKNDLIRFNDKQYQISYIC